LATVESSIDINVGVSTAYDQWTQFEKFPEFMEAVESVVQLDDSHLHWVVEMAGQTREWDAEITEQIPDQRISWTSMSGEPNSGRVSFEPLGSNSCRVHLRLDYTPEGIERAAEWTGMTQRQIKDDLERFRSFIESRGEATGSWRGTIAA
jgi:uncharacterized membrane protein